MSFEQKYLKYKQKYLALKEQSSFAQGSSLKQKYLALKQGYYNKQIGGGRFNIKMDFTRGPPWSYDVFFSDESGRTVGLVGFTDGYLDGAWSKDVSYDGVISLEDIAEMRVLAIDYGRSKYPSKFPGGGAGSAAPSAASAPVSSSTTTTGDSGGNSSASSAAAATTFASSSTTTTTAALAPGAPTLSQAEIGLFTAIDAVNLAEVGRLITTGSITDLNVRSPAHSYHTPLLHACFKLSNLPEGDSNFAALEEIILLLIRSGANVNASYFSFTPFKIIDMYAPTKSKRILTEIKAYGGVEETDAMYVPPPPPPQ